MERQLKYNPEAFVENTMRNVAYGELKLAKHDTWIDGNSYCLCKDDIDADGEKVYTAYQLYLAPEVRSLAKVRSLIKFLTFYAQKQQYKRLYVISSRLDNIKAYSRGLGKDFKIKTVIFTKEL